MPMICYNCSQQIELEQKPGRKDTCPKCSAYLHCCRNCRFYDKTAHNQCLEPQAEWVQDKESGNFCEYFEVANNTQTTDDSRKAEALKRLNDLFKK